MKLFIETDNPVYSISVFKVTKLTDVPAQTVHFSTSLLFCYEKSLGTFFFLIISPLFYYTHSLSSFKYKDADWAMIS